MCLQGTFTQKVGGQSFESWKKSSSQKDFCEINEDFHFKAK